MTSQEIDGILRLIEDSSSKEEFLLKMNNEARKHEVISALEGTGRRYELENDFTLDVLDTISIGVGVKLYEYVYREPPMKPSAQVNF